MCLLHYPKEKEKEKKRKINQYKIRKIK